ncbi:MAG: hypothetical protein ACE5GH_01110, partial [Fidelibacterota bacterium]
GQMDQNLTKGRKNLAVKYDAYAKAIEAGIADEALDALEETAIQSNARSFSTELQFVESSLPLPFDSLKVGPSFVVEADSVDLFFEVVSDIDDMTKELQELRTKVAQYQMAKAEMEGFLEREKALSEEIRKGQAEVENLNAKLDTTRTRQKKGFSRLDTKLSSKSDSLTRVIRQVDATIKTDISSLASGIADSITAQKQMSDSLSFQLETNVEYLQEEIDSLKSVVRYYDIAEKGLPQLDEDVLGILKLPTLRNKITLRNGTIVVGQILAENLDVIVMQTAVGKLVIEKNFITRYDENIFPGPKVEFEGDYQMTEYPDREEFTGVVRNVGQKNADFVKVTFFLWDATTNPIAVGSAFVDGITRRFSTGVISDASVPPGGTARYHLTVQKQPGKKVAYRTNDIKWRGYE